MSFFSKNPMFDKLVDKATSHLLLEPDWASNMTVCDMIRQGEVTGKYAVQSVKKKLNHSNPHVILYALNLVEAMAKNCGSNVHDEINTVDFMTQIKNLVKEKDPVKTKALELIQIWANAFRNQSKYGIIKQTYTNLKNSGQVFPPVIESDAMFISETAPEWQDSDCCYRCKVVFSTLRRKNTFFEKFTKSPTLKHHCRNCGNIFCDECTNKRSSIPKYGIEKEVRVCESCYDTIKGNPNLIDTRVASGSGGNGPTVQFSDDVTIRNIPSDTTNQEAARLQKERELELQEKEELELALALSASEAETQNRYKQPDSRQYQQSHQQEIEPGYNANQATSIYSTLDTSEMDPELARYLNRNYWDNKAGSIAVTQPSAPVMPNSPSNSTKQSNSTSGTVTTSLPSGGNSTAVPNNNTCLDQEQLTTEQQEFLRALRSSIEIFVNRMQSNKQRGRSIANDSSVQTLFLTLNAMHPQLLQQINQQDDRRSYLESLQDKLAQIRDAREALDALREEHRDKKRREEEEAARIRQIQMMQKLELMREKKKQYLDYQRQLAVDRMQQQERDMAVKLAQQQYQMQLRQYQQQYPYSNMQQQNQQYMMQDPNNPSVGAGTTGSYVQQQQQQQPPPLQHNYQDFYNMQGMMQQLPYSNQIPYSQQQTVGTPGNIYTNQAAGGSVIPQNQHQDNNSLNQLPNPPTHEPQMTSDTTTQHATQHHHPNKQSEQQLISFD